MNKIFKLTQTGSNKGFYFFTILFVFFISSSSFAQKNNLDVPSDEVSMNSNIVIENPVKEVSSSVNSNVNFILWFMGTKEDVGNRFSVDGMYSKKSFMTSGREPNHLLVKTLLKKALNIKSC